MVESLNTKVDMTIEATSYLGLTSYGKVMVGDKAFEFYNDKNSNDYIQIPWQEVHCVMASVLFKGKWIPRFVIVTKEKNNFTFSSRDNKALLRAINKYIQSENLVRSLGFMQIVTRGVKLIFSKNKK